MTLLVLTGLHGSGKSHLSEVISSRFGWLVHVKRKLLSRLYSESGSSEQWEDWCHRWYSSAAGIAEITQRMIKLLPKQGNHVLDSIHNINEWRVVKSAYSDSILATVIAPSAVRLVRNGDEDPSLDHRRIGYWHDSDGSCLMSECNWCFNGAVGPKTSVAEFKSLLKWLSTR